MTTADFKCPSGRSPTPHGGFSIHTFESFIVPALWTAGILVLRRYSRASYLLGPIDGIDALIVLPKVALPGAGGTIALRFSLAFSCRPRRVC